MKIVSIIFLAITCACANGESLIRKYFSVVNSFAVKVDSYAHICGDTPTSPDCNETERSVKEHTLRELNSLLSYNVYGDWKEYLNDADFASDSYNDFWVYNIHKITEHDGYYLVLTETDIDYVTFKIVVNGDRICERLPVKRLKKKIKKID